MTTAHQHHQHGLLDLRFGRDGRRSRLLHRRQQFPLRITAPLYLDPADPGMAFIYVQNPTGGVFGGDQLTTAITTDHGARVHLTTQSATKLNRMDGQHAYQHLRFHLDRDSYLEYLPDPIIPQAGSRLDQHTTVNIDHRATFVATEILTPGRLARGERFAYERVALRTEVRRTGEPLCVDATVFEPTRHPPHQLGCLGGWNYLATLLIISPQRTATDLAHQLDAHIPRDDGILAAAGTLPQGNGATLRMLAQHGPPIRRALTTAVSAVRTQILGHPLPTLRK